MRCGRNYVVPQSRSRDDEWPTKALIDPSVKGLDSAVASRPSMLLMKDTTLSIGRFSHLTGLTTRALRLYDELRLLPPYAVDAETGYRSYTPDQIKDANLISRLRGIDMPLEEVGLFLGSDIPARQRSLAHHRTRLVERRDTA